MGTSSNESALGPWLFGTVALLLVAGLAYQAGKARGGRDKTSGESVLGEPPTESRSAQGAARDTAAALSTTPTSSGPGALTELAARGAADEGRDRRPPSRAAADEAEALTYTVSHDLRAPVRVVEGFARILKEDYGRQLDRIGNDHLDRVLSASARMNAMIDAMLALARISTQPLSRQPVNLSQMASFVLEDLKRAAPQRRVEVDIEQRLEVTGDPTLMRQVMENLLSNAWKYTARTEAARITVRSLTDNAGRAVIEVGDNGAGFDMRSSERLFGLFQRLHGQHDFPGTGVGLASVQRILRRHGGDIWAESAPGEGARFRFTLG